MKRMTRARRFALALLITLLPLAGWAEEIEFVRVTDDGLFKQRPQWSPDGKQVVFARHRGATIFLFLRQLESGREIRLTERDDPEYDAMFSPDGKQLVFAFDKTSPNQGNLEIYTIDLQERQPRPLAVDSGKLSHEESPCWSPDGRRVAFTSTREGNQELFLCAADGGGWTRLTSDPAIDAHPCWSPSGEWIAFATNRWGDLEIAVLRPDATGLQRLTHSQGLDDYPSWSPDGNRLAWTSNRTGNFEIVVAPFDPQSNPPVVEERVENVSQHAGIDNFPSWTADGRLGFVSNRRGGFDVYVTDVPLP